MSLFSKSKGGLPDALLKKVKHCISISHNLTFIKSVVGKTNNMCAS